MMSVLALAAGNVGVAYVNMAFRTLGLLQFQDTSELKDLESVVVQVSSAWLGCLRAYQLIGGICAEGGGGGGAEGLCSFVALCSSLVD